jgi:hypothetical protein
MTLINMDIHNENKISNNTVSPSIDPQSKNHFKIYLPEEFTHVIKHQFKHSDTSISRNMFITII